MDKGMIFPQKLKEGDTIGLVAPSSHINFDNITKCKEAVEALGYKAVLGNSADKSYMGYLSGDDDVRARDINEMFERKDVSGIFCLRGGYGSCRIVDKLDLDLIRKNPKVFVGYSDITTLHLVLNQICNMVTYHAPMVSSNMLTQFDDYTKKSFLDTLFMDEELEFLNPEGTKIETLSGGCGEGVLTGGNLSLIAASIGTPYEIDTEDRILFIEEVDEHTYRVDRFLQQLKHSGKLAAVKGIILGSFKNCGPEHEGDADLMEIFTDIIKPLNKPTVYGVECGHCYPTGSLPMGVTCKLDADKGRIIFSK